MLGLTHSAQDLPLHQPGAAGSDEISCLFAFTVMQKLMAIGIKHTTVSWLQACSRWPHPSIGCLQGTCVSKACASTRL